MEESIFVMLKQGRIIINLIISGRIASVAFLVDESMIASVSRTEEIRLWLAEGWLMGAG